MLSNQKQMKMYKNSHIQNIYKKSKKILNRQFQTGIRTTETDTNKKKTYS